MDPERWKRVSGIFEAALGRGLPERPAFLAEACGQDASLRAEVEELLAAHEAGGSLLEGGALRIAQRLARAAGAAEDVLDTGESGLAPGARLGPYEIVEIMGAGGMGEVYRARDPRLGREVAVKVIRRAAPLPPDAERRFQLEARAAGALNHPAILTVYDVGAEGGVPYVVTELLEGETLRERLRTGPPPVDDCVEYARQIVAGLAAAHEKGIVHRDLKPENLFLTRDGRVKILDFGLAKRFQGEEPGRGAPDPSLTRAGYLLGTVRYMSPEQVRGRPADPRSDIFSFGAVLYEMLSGRRAFAGESAGEAMSAVLTADPLRLSWTDIPRPLESLARRCLNKAPEDRFQSARDLAFALEAIAATAGAPTASAPAPPQPVPSVAVLPFVNLSADPEQDYFCEGIAEDLRNALARLPGLRVAGRSSAFRFKGRGDDLRRIGRELGVERVIEGSVRKAGARLRITVQLVSVADGYHQWSERFDRGVEDVFAVQDEITARVVEALSPRLGGHAIPLRKRHTDDLEAYHLYLKGRYYWNKRHEGGMLEGLKAFQQAIDRDPSYAPAHAGVADSYALLGSWFDVLPGHEAMPRAKAAALRALELDPELAEAHASLAWVRLHYEWDWPAAEQDFRRSLDLDPGRAATHHWYSFFLSAMGRGEEAAAEAQRAWELEPLALIINANLAQPHYFARRFDRAIAEAEKLIRMEPAFPVAHQWLALACAAERRYGEAIAANEAYAAAFGRTTRTLALIAHARARSGDRDGALRDLETIRALAGERHVPAAHFALVHIGLGEVDEAFRWLEQAYEERFDWLAYLAVEPLFDPVRDDPRFEALLGRLRLREAASRAGRTLPTSPAGPPRKSVAVLPFRSLSADPGSAHLGLGLADATITELALQRALLVRPTSAILRFQDRGVDPLEAARELGVDAVLEGTFQRSGRHRRVTVRLLATGGGEPLWAAKIDTSLDDIFRLQDEVAQAIAGALEVELTAADRSRRERHAAERPAAAQAYDFYMRGRAHFVRENLEEIIAAVDWFEKAREVDAGFALAWAGLADAYLRIAFDFQPEGNWYERAQAACERTLTLDPALPEGLYARGRLRWSPQAGWDHAGALRDLMAAIAARPSLDDAHRRTGIILYHVGLVREAMERFRQALALSPEHLARYHLGFCHYHLGDYEKALELTQGVADRAIARWIHYQIALCQVRLGRLEEAERTAAQLRRGYPILALVAALRGDADEAHAQIRLVEADRRAFGHYHHAQYEVASAYARLGEPDDALAWLEASARNGYPCLALFERDPFLDPLRGLERFERLMGEIREECAGYARLYAELRAADSEQRA